MIERIDQRTVVLDGDIKPSDDYPELSAVPVNETVISDTLAENAVAEYEDGEARQARFAAAKAQYEQRLDSEADKLGDYSRAEALLASKGLTEPRAEDFGLAPEVYVDPQIAINKLGAETIRQQVLSEKLRAVDDNLFMPEAEKKRKRDEILAEHRVHELRRRAVS